MNGKWERNEVWIKDLWLMILTFALVLSLLVGVVGWVRYRDALKTQIENERMIGNFFSTIE